MVVASSVFGGVAGGLRTRLTGLYAVLGGANLVAWIAALIAFRDHPALLGTALLAYGFGLRHAVDADHIAAIDNVTRKLMQQGQRPVAVGFFFALGHSTVVVVAGLVIAVGARTLAGRFPELLAVGGVIGTAMSAGFLLIIAIINIVVLVGVYRLFRRVRGGRRCDDAELDLFLSRRGLLGRVFRRLFGLITQSWHMYPLGFLFGLGFDTATEIGLLGISASEAAHGLPLWSILVFPALFTAGMALIDTTDGVLMLGAYGWAFVNPLRKLYYNMTITGVSVVVALAVGGIETLGLIAGRLGLSGGLWGAVSTASTHFGVLGYAIIALFVASWLGPLLVHRARGHGRIGRARWSA